MKSIKRGVMMFIRSALTVCMVSFVAGCFNGMKVDIAPPMCSLDFRTSDCGTAPKDPKPMSDELFFQNETNLLPYWNTTA